MSLGQYPSVNKQELFNNYLLKLYSNDTFSTRLLCIMADTISGSLNDLAGQLLAAKDVGVEPAFSSTAVALPIDVSIVPTLLIAACLFYCLTNSSCSGFG